MKNFIVLFISVFLLSAQISSPFSVKNFSSPLIEKEDLSQKDNLEFDGLDFTYRDSKNFHPLEYKLSAIKTKSQLRVPFFTSPVLTPPPDFS